MSLSIAVVSFLPDAGHVMPLLRIAAAFAERGHAVTCYLPEECANFLSEYDFEFVSLGPVIDDTIKSRYHETLRKLSARSIFYNAFSLYRDLPEGYLDPLRSAVGHHLAPVKAGLSRQRPRFVLSDDHAFLTSYIGLARELAMPLVIHSTEGFRPYQDRYVQFYGISDLPRAAQMLVERLGGILEGWSKFVWCLHKIANGQLPRVETRTQRESNGPRARQPIVISTGCGYLEQRLLNAKLRICDDLPVFGPLDRAGSVRLPTDLRTWLLEGDDVVYISFGSMVRLEAAFVQAILDGLAMLKVRALWSMPQAQQDELLPRLDVRHSVCFKASVPPAEVLGVPGVRCGINHGGAGSVQDCLLSGKPMLCIPFMWDQPFNGSVVEQLGVGKRLWRRRVCAASIAAAVGSILSDQRMARRAAELAIQLRHSDSAARVVAYVLDRLRPMN